MDYQTAYQVIFKEVQLHSAHNSFLKLLSQGQAPIPGQVTNILLALKMIGKHVATETEVGRSLAYAVHVLAIDSRRYYDRAVQKGHRWPPLLSEDLDRIGEAVKDILRPVD